MTIGNIGIVHLDLKDYDSALYYHFEALEIYKKLNDLYGFANYSNSIAEIYLDMGKPHSAYPYILDGLKFSKEINAKKLLSDSYWFLAKYYSETNEHQKAYETQKTLINLKDSLLNQEMAEKIAEMQTRYEVDKKEQEIHLLTKDNEIQTLKIKKQSVQLYFLIAFILLIAIVTILMFNRYHLKQKHYHVELEKKNLETEQRLLRSQMNPHFIFNSMNSIQSYISGNDNFTAMAYLSKFAQLMRGILENSREAMISLEEEINTLVLYIELEQLRFKNKFDYKLEFGPEIYPETTYIPPMLVQPFVENAIKHGLRNKDGKGLLKIGFRKRNRLIECIIEDNGIGREQAKAMYNERNKNHQSLGMQVTHDRIDAFKKDKNANSNL
jgi:LytS/YehU family sensor histidine kinase